MRGSSSATSVVKSFGDGHIASIPYFTTASKSHQMKEEWEQSGEVNRISGKEDARKRKISRLFSCFSSSKDGEERSTKDEVLKPLYFIVGDVDSEQMEGTVESIDGLSIENETKIAKSYKESRPRRVDFCLFRLFRGIMKCRGNKRAIENPSLGLVTRMNESEHDDGLSEGTKNSVFKKLQRTSGGEHEQERFLRTPFVNSSNSVKRHDSFSLSSNIEENVPCAQLEIDGDKVCSEEGASCLRPAALGVTFAHPVYTGKCRLLTEDTRPDTNLLWTKMRADIPVEVDEFALPAAKTIVETTTAESWGSVGSSSLYPTDEESREDGNIHYYGSFDSDDIPFDEIFTDTRFFEI